jgi:hypothetical protein
MPIRAGYLVRRQWRQSCVAKQPCRPFVPSSSLRLWGQYPIWHHPAWTAEHSQWNALGSCLCLGNAIPDGSEEVNAGNPQPPNRKFSGPTPQLWVSPIYPPITRNAPKHARPSMEGWCGCRDLDLGRRVPFHDNIQFSFSSPTQTRLVPCAPIVV